MKPTIELVVDPDCPNVDAARRILSRALSQAGLPHAWSERVQPTDADPAGEAPDRYPSPTILVDGVEVGEPSRGRGCRIYRDADGRLGGTPSVEQVVEVIREAREERGP